MTSEVHFDNIKFHIQTELKKAKETVIVAVAWFTDDDLFNDLVNLSKKGVYIQLILNEDEINKNSGLEYPILYRNGGMVYFVDAQEILMHNKFCVIDKKIVLNGSFNWTRKASSNLENLTIIRDGNASSKFTKQFQNLKKWTTSYFEEIDINHPDFVNNTTVDNLSVKELITRAKNKRKNGNYLASLLDFKKVLEIDKTKGKEILFDLAYCQSELDDNQSAIENYSKLINFNINCSASLNNRALLYEKEEYLKLSYDDFTKAIEIEPNTALYYKNRADLTLKFAPIYESYARPFFLTDEWDWLIGTEKIEEVKDDRLVEEEKFMHMDNLEKVISRGIKDYLEVIKLDENCDQGEIYSNIAEIYFDISNHVKSIEFYSKAIQNKGDYHYGYYSRGLSHFILNNFKQSISDIENALRIKPNYKTYIDLLKRIKKERRKLKNWFK